VWLGVWRGGLDKLLSRKAEVESESMGSMELVGWRRGGVESVCRFFEMGLALDISIYL
jgi:hypothetical protein